MHPHGDPVPANNGVFYFQTAPLGSTTVTVNAAGNPAGDLRYRAFGATRFASASPGTEYRYTGQREVGSIGLYFCRARWYDPALGRFVQADNVGADDRYAYVRNNPLAYVDPSGHRRCNEQWGCEGAPQHRAPGPPLPVRLRAPTRAETDQLRDVAEQATRLSENLLAPLMDESFSEPFEAAYGSLTIVVDPTTDLDEEVDCETVYPAITCVRVPPLQTLLHEFTHAFDVRYQTLSGDSYLASDYVPIDWNTRFEGYMCNTFPCLAHSIRDFPDIPHPLSEEFGDMYMNYIMEVADLNRAENGFTSDDWGNQRRWWMSSKLPRFLEDMGLR